jgi:hypothetical protein
MSSFNPETFLFTETTNAFETETVPVPVGEWSAIIKSIKPRALSDGRGVLDVYWIVLDEEVKAELDMAEPMVRQSIWLDLDDNGNLADGKNKNVQLGQLRDAVSQNRKGQPWAPGMLINQMAKVKVSHSIDKRDNKTVQADVTGVTAI